MNPRADRIHAFRLTIAILVIVGMGITAALPVALPLIEGIARIGSAIVG